MKRLLSLLILAVLVLTAYATPSNSRSGVPAAPFSASNSDEIVKLCQQALTKNAEPTAEGEIFLEYRSQTGIRQYVTVTLAKGFLGEYAGVERVDFIQELWMRNANRQDVIEQWVVSTTYNGNVVGIWHKRIIEEKSLVVGEEYLPVNEKEATSVVRKIVARFLKP